MTRSIAGEVVFIVLAMVLGYGALALARPGAFPPATPGGPATNAPLTATVAPAVTFTPQTTLTGTTTAQPTSVPAATTASTPSPERTSGTVVSVTPSTTPVPAPVATATATPRPTPRPTPIPTPIVYVVQAGDSLDAIARKFGVTVDALSRANHISNPDQLAQGQKLIIPRR